MNSISEIHEKYLNRQMSVVDVVDRYLATIQKYDKNLNAMITVMEDSARVRAIQLNEVLEKEGEQALSGRPLFGVPIIFKDMYLTKGVLTTAASKVLENYIPQYSSTVVERIENAGGIVLGKANQDAWAHGSSGENSDFGPTRNPWNIESTPGGSSSGSAVAIAADYSVVSFGTDTGGSIRLPASFCGVVGFKPTYGVVPRYGVIAMASSLDSMGHFARSVEDIEKVFSITRGPDGKDATVVDNSKYQESHVKGTYKVGIPKEYFGEGLDSEVQKIIDDAIVCYKRQGVEFVEVSLPHTSSVLAVYYIVMSAEVSSNLGRYDGVRYGEGRDMFGAEAKRRIMLGTYVLSAGYYDAYYLKAMKVRSKLIQDFEAAFSEVDAILAPVSPTPPFKLGEKVTDPLQMYLADIYTVAANLTGIPGLAIPAGFTHTGLPVGFQLLGPRFSEQSLFELGKMYQRETDFHLQRPQL
jgi:aspartyl-tRNA(Asn)/glutamyl-tRNA(Gln) amidotransferase subunit A